MKTRVIVAFIAILITTNVYSQPLLYYNWIQKQSPTSNNLNCIRASLTDLSEIWICGDNGTILRSSNGGENWQQLSSGTTVNLRSIYKLSSGAVLAVGDNGTIIRSTNDGVSWLAMNLGITQNLNSVGRLLGGNTAIVGGNNGTLIYTLDAGVTWTTVSSGITNNILCFSNYFGTGKLIYAGSNDGKIIRITVTYPPLPPSFGISVINSISGRDIKQIEAIDSLNYYFSGTLGTFYSTTNGGNTFNNLYTSNTISINSFFRRTASDIFIFQNTGFIKRTTNSGVNWISQTSFTTQNINVSMLYRYTRGFAIGNGGTILTSYFPDSTNSKKIQILFGNKIRSFFENNGVFNQNTRLGNTSGFSWPGYDTNKTLIFTTGLSIAGIVNGSLRMAGASYLGEYWSGEINNFVPYTNEYHKIFSVRNTDNSYNSLDYANWGHAVQQGAPYVDVNHNNIYDVGIDIPGYLNSTQTIFMCLTDGFPNRHNNGTGMGGGTAPMNAQLRITAWSFSNTTVEDVQYIKFQIINSGQYNWQNTYMAIFADPDVGGSMDDYIGCDVQRNLGYAYNGNNYDPVYGAAPPAVGMRLLRFAVNRSVAPNDTLKLSVFGQPFCNGCNVPWCEIDPWGDAEGYYNMMKGYKKDGSPWMDPTFTPPQPTKMKFPGEPETKTNWVEARGSVWNCGGTTGTIVDSNPPFDRRYIMGWGALNWVMAPGDTQVIVMAQLVGRGNSNLNSVTRLKQVSDNALNFYNNSLIGSSVSGTVRYNDNNQTVSGGYVKALKLNKSNGTILVLDSAGIQNNGTYVLPNVPADSCYIGVYPNSGTTPDYIPGYYPGVINWMQAIQVYPFVSLTNIDISVSRLVLSSTTNSINGRVFRYGDGGIMDGILYIKYGNTFVNYGISDYLGIYHINSIPNGTLKVIIHRIGFSSDSTNVTVNNNNIDSVNFYLNQMFVGIKREEGTIPEAFRLYQNYPNPFNPLTKIKFDLQSNSSVALKVYDLLGREVKSLVNQYLSGGSYELTFDASDLSSGVYFLRIQAGDFVQVKRMILMK